MPDGNADAFFSKQQVLQCIIVIKSVSELVNTKEVLVGRASVRKRKYIKLDIIN